MSLETLTIDELEQIKKDALFPKLKLKDCLKFKKLPIERQEKIVCALILRGEIVYAI